MNDTSTYSASELESLAKLYAELKAVRHAGGVDAQASSADSLATPQSPLADEAASPTAAAASSEAPLLILTRKLPYDLERDAGTGEVGVKRSQASRLSDLSDALCAFQCEQRASSTGSACLWMGWGGRELEQLDPSEAEQLLPKMKAKYGMFPVALRPAQHALFYDGYCKSILWPVLHNNAPTRSWSQGLGVPRTLSLDHFQWDAFFAANQAYADTVQEACFENAFASDPIVWIHGYHLMLTPLMVRAKLPRARIGFFLHQPFCSSELFRVLPRRVDMIKGLLAADLLGFQTFRSASHFRRSCQRLLPVESTAEGIMYNGHFVKIVISPIGINPERYIGAVRSKEVQQRIAQLRVQLFGRVAASVATKEGGGSSARGGGVLASDPASDSASAGGSGSGSKGAAPPLPEPWSSSLAAGNRERKMVLLGIDAPDSVKGVEHKFMAFDRMLGQYPELLGRVVFVQVTLSARYSKIASASSGGAGAKSAALMRTRSDVHDGGQHSQAFAAQVARANKRRHQTVEENIDTIVGRINGKFATPGRGRAIVHLRSLPSLADLCALHCIADVCVVTPMVDGMNLVAATHVACRHANGAFAKVVLSEFAGSATSLSGAINVNPWDVEATARAMRGVLHMSASEARRRHEDMWTSTCSENFTSKYWASTFLQRLAASKRAEELVTKSPDELLRARTIAPHYRRAKRRLIILDVEDVLLHAYEYISLTGTRSGGAAAAGLSTSSSALSVSSSHLSLSSVHSQAAQRISAILDDLCADPANTVMLTSDHSKSAIETWAGARACVLCAEGGTFFRRALSGSRAPLSPTFVADAEPYAPLEEMSSTDDESAFRPTPARFGGASLLTKSSPASALGALGAIDTAPLQPHSQSQSPRAALRPPTPPPAAAEPAPPAAEVAAALHSHGAAAPEWETVHEVLALLPESPLMEVLRYFTERTPGSWIESMEAGVAWHYTSVESEHGTWQAKELVASLLDMCDRFKLAVSRCEATKTVRMRPISCSKARLVKFAADRLQWRFHQSTFSSLTPSTSAASSPLASPKASVSKALAGAGAGGAASPASSAGAFDFVLCVLSGNDSTDRDVFDLLRRSWYESAEAEGGNKSIGGPFLATLAAKRTSSAHFHCDGRIEYLRELLDALCNESLSPKRGMSRTWSGML